MASQPLVRPAEWADVAAITEIYNESVVTSTASWDVQPATLEARMQWYADHLRDGFPVLVADDDGRVVGWGAYGTFRAKAGYVGTVEHSVYVRPDAQGRGIGRALLEELIAVARSQRRHVMVGGLSNENQASLDFHRSLGFSEVGRMPQVGRKFGRWLDLVLVQLVLDDGREPLEPPGERILS